jgi:hypothetical protein
MDVWMVGAMALTRNTSYASGVSSAAFFPAIRPNIMHSARFPPPWYTH